MNDTVTTIIGLLDDLPDNNNKLENSFWFKSNRHLKKHVYIFFFIANVIKNND